MANIFGTAISLIGFGIAVIALWVVLSSNEDAKDWEEDEKVKLMLAKVAVTVVLLIFSVIFSVTILIFSVIFSVTMVGLLCLAIDYFK
jgi:uncharacterized membrane protein